MDDTTILKTLMGALMQIKLYHWATMKYSHHKALDTLHSDMQEHVDKFVEVYMGRFKRQPLGKFTVTTSADTDAAPAKIEKYLESTRDDIAKMHKSFTKTTELQTILDDMMSSIDQAIYLCRLG
jgi:DNA-binding ferritin-like protein